MAPLYYLLNFPKAYDVNDTFLTDKLDLEDMREWNQRPTKSSYNGK